MSGTTVLAPAAVQPHSRPQRYWRWWLLGVLVLLGSATAIVLWARTRPGYDPYGWLVWGKLTVHGRLDTNGAPSWKPLPYVFTLPYALLGNRALGLWMVTAVAVSFMGPVFAWRLAGRLINAPGGDRHLAAAIGGAVAAATTLGIRDYAHFILSFQSDTMIVSLCLAAVDCWLRDRPRWALWLWVLAALGRPEVWPFLGAYCVWAWLTVPRMRAMVVGGLLAIPLLWFGIPALTAKSPFIAGDIAMNSPRALHSNKLWGALDRFLDLHELPLWVAALSACGVAALWRRRAVLLLALGALVWVAIEVAFVLHGYPGVPRYLFEPAAMACVLAGVAAGWVWLALPVLAARLRINALAGTVAALALIAGFAGVLVPAAASRLRVERSDLKGQRSRTVLLNHLGAVVRRVGVARIERCGYPALPVSYQSVFAWYTDFKIGALYINEPLERRHPVPIVRIVPDGENWRLRPVYIPRSRAAPCRVLPAVVG